MATKIGNLITLDGTFSDWPAGDMIMTPGNTVAGYQVYGAKLNDATLGQTYVLGIDATIATDPVIGAGTVIYLNNDQNAATGYSPFGNIGAEYEVQFALSATGTLQPYLYSVTSTGATTLLNGGAPLASGFSSNGESAELAIPQSLLTPAGGAAPTSVNFAALVNNTQGLPSNFTNATEYTINDPATLVATNSAIKKVGIVFSATTAALYFGGGQAGQTAYSDLFMSAQHQAEAAGVSYDILTESDLTNVAKLAQYSALIFPSFQDVQSSQVSAIASALQQVVYNYHVPIITAGAFMTNDQSGNPLAGNSYANMQNLLNLTQTSYGTATYTVTPDATALANKNPVMAGFTSGERIGGSSGLFPNTTAGTYTNYGYLNFSGFTKPATTLADINIQGGATLPGVMQTTTGATNTVFATTEIMGDSNLLQHAIQNAVFGTAPSLSIDITRFAGVLNSRNDTEDSQYPADVSPASGKGIYSELIPMLQQWQQQYDFVGTYFINVGDNANPDNANSTNWAVSKPIYDQLLEMGNEIGSHSYTHLINPPAYEADGVTPVPNITVTANGVTQTVNSWSENTNTLYVTAPPDAPNWTFAYEFGTGNSVIQSNLGIPIAGAAVPGANDTVATSDNIEKYYQTSALPAGLTGYVEGGWTGADSGSPNAFGYIDPSDTGSVYIAPNMTFDFSEIQYWNKTPAQADGDWEALLNQLSANSATPVIVWPWHDYGPTNWSDPGSTTTTNYNEAMFTNFIAYAYSMGYEFVTSEDLASRIAAEQAATLSETTSGNVITATVTPAPTKLDLGAMALNVVNGAAGQVIQNAGSWYAYDSNSVFMPYGGGSFKVTLGTTQDDVTHVDYLPMRADLKSVSGNGTNLTFTFTGDGMVDVHLKTPGTNFVSIAMSAVGAGAGPVSAMLVGDDLKLDFNDGLLAISSSSPQGVPVQHTVTITESTTPAIASGAINFGPTNNILFQNVNGQAETWQVNGTALGATSIVGPNPGPFWLLQGTGAFFAGDTADYLWRGRDGSVAIWQMNGNNPGSKSAVIAGNPGTSWFITGAGDFYRDGHTDILWQNNNGAVALWEMNGTTVTQAGVVAGNPGSAWHIKGTGDFYGDGHTDILWQNDNGAVALWEMNGTTVTQAGVVAGNPGPAWHIKGTGDFYGDGHTDILWQNDNGAVALWEMNGTTVTQAGVVAGNPGPSWHIVGTGDFNGDGKTDIAWRNDNGSVAVWDMTGTTVQASAVLANPGTSWNVSGFDSMQFIYPTQTNAPLAATPSADEFVLTSLSSGSQTITGFDPMQDIVELSKAKFASIASVQAATSAIAGGAMINLGNGSSVVLTGVDPAWLHASNFALA